MVRAAFVYDEAVSQHVLRDDHVMRPTRLKYTYELLEAYGAFKDSKLIQPRHATIEELLWFHTAEYVEAVHSISRNGKGCSPERYNFSQYGDNPPYIGMYEASTLSTGASGGRRAGGQWRGRGGLQRGRWTAPRCSGPRLRLLHLQ